ncbi:MAG: HAMP domain-containing sensor histidine kinase [Gemmatimonadaceae bacterium]
MPNETRPAANGVARDLRWALATGVAVALVVSLGGVFALAAVADVARVLPWLAGAIVGAIAIVAGAAFYKQRNGVERPIAALASAARAAAAGDLSEPASEQGVDEYRDIALAINRIARELRSERHKLRQLEKLADAGRIAAGVAHEIGNPLTAIGNAIEMLRHRNLSPNEQRSILDRMEREITRAGRMANGLIDVSRPRAMTALKVDVNEAARGTMRLLTDQGLLRQHRGMLLLDSTDPFVMGNRHDLEQIFVNLLLNAIDATPPDGKIVIATNRVARAKLEQGVVRRTNDPPLTIKPRRDAPVVKSWLNRVRPPAEIISIVVADSGPGIPREDWGRVFEPFFTTKGPGQGTGLGLAVVHNLVESLRGTIWVDRAREGGAAFHMLFPVAVAGAMSDEDLEPAPARALSGD